MRVFLFITTVAGYSFNPKVALKSLRMAIASSLLTSLASGVKTPEEDDEDTELVGWFDKSLETILGDECGDDCGDDCAEFISTESPPAKK